VDLDVYEGTANFRVRFLVADEESEKQTVSFASGPDPDADDRGLLTFTNWNKKVFRGTVEPVIVAIVNNKNLYLLYGVSYDEGLYHVRLQFMEDTSEESVGGQANV
jgi:hypothetical protein